MILNTDGGILDDVMMSTFQEDVLMVVNASNVEKLLDWFDSFDKQREQNLRGGTGDGISADAIASMVANLSDTANQLGVDIEDAMLVDIATLALRRKYNDAQIVDQLFSKVDG